METTKKPGLTLMSDKVEFGPKSNKCDRDVVSLEPKEISQEFLHNKELTTT